MSEWGFIIMGTLIWVFLSWYFIGCVRSYPKWGDEPITTACFFIAAVIVGLSAAALKC